MTANPSSVASGSGGDRPATSFVVTSTPENMPPRLMIVSIRRSEQRMVLMPGTARGFRVSGHRPDQVDVVAANTCKLQATCAARPRPPDLGHRRIAISTGSRPSAVPPGGLGSEVPPMTPKEDD